MKTGLKVTFLPHRFLATRLLLLLLLQYNYYYYYYYYYYHHHHPCVRHMTSSHSIHAAMWLCWMHKSFISLNMTSQTTHTACCIIFSMRNCFFGLSEHLTGTQIVTRSLTLRQHICPIIAQFLFFISYS